MASSARPKSVVNTALDKYDLEGSYVRLQDYERAQADRLCGGNVENSAVNSPPIPMTNKGGESPAGA